MSEAKWEGLVGSQAGACQALGGNRLGEGSWLHLGRQKGKAVSSLRPAASHQGKVGLRLLDLKRQGCLGVL